MCAVTAVEEVIPEHRNVDESPKVVNCLEEK